jgi:hypothetical protein
MKWINKIGLLFLASLLLTNCKTPIYFPNRVNSPMLNNQGDVNVDVSIGTSGLDFQGAVSPIKNFGLIVNYTTINGTHSHSFFDGGLGYYHGIGKKGLFEIYGGYGLGNASSTSKDILGNTTTLTSDYSRIFIQPAIGLLVTGETQPERKVRGNSYFAVRFSQIDFGSNQQALFIEPALGGRIGWKNIQFNSQMGFSFPTVKGKVESLPFILNIGITYAFRKSNKQ